MKNIDFKSLLIGLLVGICVLAVLGMGENPSGIGRYRVSSDRPFFVDTVTGRIWYIYNVGLSGRDIEFREIGSPVYNK